MIKPLKLLRKINFSDYFFLVWLPSFSIIALGVTVTLVRYFVDRSLWLDEAFLALNIVNRDYTTLTQVLDHNQVSPILFLFLEKLLLGIFPDPDYALRIFPTLCFILSLLLIYKTTKILTKNCHVAVSAVCLLSVSPFFLSYATEVKPYMSDAFVALLLLYISLRVTDMKFGLTILCLSGIISIYLSNASVIILCSIGFYLLYQARALGLNAYPLVFVIFIWIFSFGVNYHLLLSPSLGNPYFKEYWGNKFLPFSHPEFWYFGTHVLKTIGRTIFAYPLHHWTWKLFGFLYISCFLSIIFNRAFSYAYLLVFPLLLHLLLSSLELYPFVDRLLFYQIPLFVMVIAYGVVHYSKMIVGGQLTRLATFLPALILIPGHFLSLPIVDGGIRPSIEYLKQNAGRDDIIFIYPTAHWEYQYYEAVGLAPKATRTLDLTAMRETISSLQSYCLNDKLWLVFSGVNPNIEDEVSKQDYVISHMKDLNLEIDQISFEGSSVYFVSFNNGIKSINNNSCGS